MKTNLLNEYSKLRAIDWRNAGDVSLDRMTWAFDRIKSSAKCFSAKELKVMIAEIKERHQKEGAAA